MIAALKSDINPKNIKIVVVILGKPADKKDIKQVLDKGGVPSQFITVSKLFDPKMSVISNILKQMNAKLK